MTFNIILLSRFPEKMGRNNLVEVGFLSILSMTGMQNSAISPTLRIKILHCNDIFHYKSKSDDYFMPVLFIIHEEVVVTVVF